MHLFLSISFPKCECVVYSMSLLHCENLYFNTMRMKRVAVGMPLFTENLVFYEELRIYLTFYGTNCYFNLFYYKILIILFYYKILIIIREKIRCWEKKLVIPTWKCVWTWVQTHSCSLYQVICYQIYLTKFLISSWNSPIPIFYEIYILQN